MILAHSPGAAGAAKPVLFLLSFACSPLLPQHGPWLLGKVLPPLCAYLLCSASVGLELEQTDDTSLQVRDQDAFCFIPIEGFDLGGQELVSGCGDGSGGLVGSLLTFLLKSISPTT